MRSYSLIVCLSLLSLSVGSEFLGMPIILGSWLVCKLIYAIFTQFLNLKHGKYKVNLFLQDVYYHVNFPTII